MRDRYNFCLSLMNQQLTAYATASAILIDAARSIASRYSGSDALAAATTAKVTSALDDAIAVNDCAPSRHHWDVAG